MRRKQILMRELEALAKVEARAAEWEAQEVVEWCREQRSYVEEDIECLVSRHYPVKSVA